MGSILSDYCPAEARAYEILRQREEADKLKKGLINRKKKADRFLSMKKELIQLNKERNKLNRKISSLEKKLFHQFHFEKE